MEKQKQNDKPLKSNSSPNRNGNGDKTTTSTTATATPPTTTTTKRTTCKKKMRKNKKKRRDRMEMFTQTEEKTAALNSSLESIYLITIILFRSNDSHSISIIPAV